MSKTMVVVSAKGVVPSHRYDFIYLPNGLGYYRYQTAETRSRWKRTDVSKGHHSLDMEADLVAGPTLIEITDAEAIEIQAGGVMHPPRNVGLRAEKVRTNWGGAHLPLSRLNGWVEEWGNATRDNDHLWIGARTHRLGRVRAGNPFALSATAATTSLPTENAPVTAPSSATGAVTPVSTPEPSAVVVNSHAYEPIVKGTVRRPNNEYYRVRKVGKNHDVHVFRDMREKRVHCLTFGQPGTGKTAMLEAAFGRQMITMLGTEDTESADFQGSYVESDSGLWVWEDGPLIIAMERGWILYIDEIGVIRQKQMSQLYSVMDGRDEIRITANPKRGVVKAAPGFAIVASTNPDSPEVRLTDALLNRFGFKLEVPSDYQMARSQFDIPEWLVNASENLEARRRNKELPWAPQTRDLLLWKQNVEILGGDTEATGVLINSAPTAARATVADVLSKGAGKAMKALVLR